MPVADALERITEAEFIDWMLWFERRDEMAERARKGQPLDDTEYADEMTPEETAAHLSAIFRGITPGK
jgi:hypothetical protein